MVKKVVIAAAGRGTRMLHLTKNKSKHLIKVCNKPFLSYLLDNLLKAGYKDLILVAGYKKEKMKQFLKDFDYKVCLVDQFEVLGKRKYGTACALECVKDIIGRENFLMIYGDHIFSTKDLKSFNIKDKYTYVAGRYHNLPQKYGALKVKDGFLEKIIEKPKEYVGNLTNIGLYKFTSEIFDKLSEVRLSERGEYELPDAINLLAKEKKVKVKKTQDYWLDFGNPADIMRVSQFLKKCKY